MTTTNTKTTVNVEPSAGGSEGGEVMGKNLGTLGEFRQATAHVPDEAILNVRSPGGYLTWGVSSVSCSASMFTSQETFLAVLEIDVDWQKLAAYAVLRMVDPRAFRACLHEMSSRALAIDSIERREMEEIIGEPIPEKDWQRFARSCMSGDREEWEQAWRKFTDRQARDREAAKLLAELKGKARRGRKKDEEDEE